MVTAFKVLNFVGNKFLNSREILYVWKVSKPQNCKINTHKM